MASVGCAQPSGALTSRVASDDDRLSPAWCSGPLYPGSFYLAVSSRAGHIGTAEGALRRESIAVVTGTVRRACRAPRSTSSSRADGKVPTLRPAERRAKRRESATPHIQFPLHQRLPPHTAKRPIEQSASQLRSCASARPQARPAYVSGTVSGTGPPSLPRIDSV
jgi:hypothetical protein